MNLTAFVNVTTRRLEATLTGQSLTLPEFTAGDRLKLSFRFLEQIEGIRSERPLVLRAARLTLGLIDQPPLSGQWSLQVGAGPSTASNTTPLLSAGISPSALQASLEALAVTTGSLSPVTVTQDAGSFLIRFGSGAQATLGIPHNSLFPSAFARIREREIGSGIWEYELRLIQSPLAAAPTFSREVPPPPTVAQIQDGSSDPSGTTFIPEIQKLVIPATFRGSFLLRFGSYQKSPILGTDLDADSLAEALATLFTPQAYKPEVVDSGDGFLIVFNDKESLGADIPTLTVEVFDAPEGDVTFDLNLSTRELFDALRGSPTRKDAILELEADILPDDATPGDLSATARTTTLFQTPVTLRRELRWDGLAAAAHVDWLRPPENASYIPFTTDQVLTGQQQAFTTVVGGGATFVVDHNLDTETPNVIVRESVTPARILRPDEYSVTVTGPDSLTLTFPATVPAPRAVTILSVGPASVFQAHTHTIAQTTGLQAALDALAERLTALEALLPRPGAAGTGAAKPLSFDVPAFGEILPDVSLLGLDTTIASQVIVVDAEKPPVPPRGTEVAEQAAAQKAAETAAQKDPETLPPNVVYRAGILGIGDPEPAIFPARAASGALPYLLPAITDASVTDVTALPSVPTWPGKVWRNTSSGALVLPGGRGRKSQSVPVNGLFGCDGRAFYRVVRGAGSSTVYHPLEMERELWRAYLGAAQFPVSARLAISGELRLRMIVEAFDGAARDIPRVDYGGQFLLVVEAVPIAGATTAGAASTPITVASTRVTLSTSVESLPWSLTAERDAAGDITASWRAYGAAAAGVSFALPSVLRMRLIGFDVDDSLSNPCGQISLTMPSTKLEVRKL